MLVLQGAIFQSFGHFKFAIFSLFNAVEINFYLFSIVIQKWDKR